MDRSDVKTLEDMDRLLDEQSVSMFSGNRTFTMAKQGQSLYVLLDSSKLDDKTFPDLGMMLVQTVMFMVEDCEYL